MCASVKIRIPGIQFDHVDARLTDLIDVRFPDVRVIGNEIIAVRRIAGKRADRNRRIIHPFNDKRVSVDLQNESMNPDDLTLVLGSILPTNALMPPKVRSIATVAQRDLVMAVDAVYALLVPGTGLLISDGCPLPKIAGIPIQ